MPARVIYTAILLQVVLGRFRVVVTSVHVRLALMVGRARDDAGRFGREGRDPRFVARDLLSVSACSCTGAGDVECVGAGA